MNFLIIYFWCLTFSTILEGGIAYLIYATTLKELNGIFCIEVGPINEDVDEVPSQPKLALILEVDYPYSVVEAGNVILQDDDLSLGKHNITYKYFISNMNHDLQVSLDGSEKKFVKSQVSGWYSVSSFRDISVLIQGNVKIISCAGEVQMKKSVNHDEGFTFMDRDSEESKEKFFIEEPETTARYFVGDLEKKTTRKPVQSDTQTFEKLPPTENISLGNLETTMKPFPGNLKTTVKPFPGNLETTMKPFPGNLEKTMKPFPGNLKTTLISKLVSSDLQPPEDKKPELLSAQKDDNKHDQKLFAAALDDEHTHTTHELETKTMVLNNSSSVHFYNSSFNFKHDNNSELGQTENVFSSDHRNYAFTMTLFIGLIGLVLFAIVISIIFHKKTKKLVLAVPRPQNKLHKLYESTEIDGETSVMLSKLENNLETEC